MVVGSIRPGRAAAADLGLSWVRRRAEAHDAFDIEVLDADDDPLDPMAYVSPEILLDDLAWWSRALERARDDGALVPGKTRAMAARRRLAS
jgi:hypothetical protein